ncbi:MAG: TrkH family potassium uptake protein [Candidatus Omnitrophota bacterium]
MKKNRTILNHNPEAMISFSFLLAILVGAILLKLPWATIHQPLSWIDAFFMSTSAVCVTGLTVIDVGRDLTLFGQLVILTLVQAGGLGIMTFSLIFLVMMGKRISLISRFSIPPLTQDINLQNVKFSLFFILTMTLIIEGIGAVLLFINLKQFHPFPFALYSAVFHSITAFCNAGFSLYSDSMIGFQNHPFILFILMGLIILGGLGFIVIYELFTVILHRRKDHRRLPLSLHTRIALSATAALLLTGGLVIWLLEGNNLLRGMPEEYKILNAFFLSVTSRTAGFTTVDLGGLSNAAVLLVSLLMFIGACPGSTGGGIKIHVFVTLLNHIRSKIRGFSSTNVFKRKIPDHIVERALAIFVYAISLLTIAIFVLQITENLDSSTMVARERFLDTVFEAASAFGTVGLSTGLTPFLSYWSKIMVIILMFVGRIGPLTFGVALIIQQRRKIMYEFPEEDVVVS